MGGEHKSDPRDARVIADQVRIRYDLRPIEPATELDIELRLLVGRRRDLVDAQTQRLSRMHDLAGGGTDRLRRGGIAVSLDRLAGTTLDPWAWQTELVLDQPGTSPQCCKA